MKLNTEVNNATGLWVYNSGTALPEGYYYWNGTEWRIIVNNNSKNAEIDGLVCTAAKLSPSSYSAGVPYSGSLRVPYIGGNAGIYSSGSSVTVNGLTFKVLPHSLNFGGGELVFSVIGTPTVSSPVQTSILIDNNLVPFPYSTSKLYSNCRWRFFSRNIFKCNSRTFGRY